MGRNKASRVNGNKEHDKDVLQQYNDSDGHFSLVRCGINPRVLLRL